ncbi:hypothetical protein [Intestinibacter sp.]
MYTQALGAILGLIACLYQYVYGQLLIIGNKPLSDMNILSIFCSYTLYPLCIIIFFMSLFLMLCSKHPNFFGKLDRVNKFTTHVTVIIGLLGCKYYFIIPGLLILYRYYIPVLLEDDLKKTKEEAQKQELIIELLNKNLGKHTIVKLLNVSYEEVEIINLQYCQTK